MTAPNKEWDVDCMKYWRRLLTSDKRHRCPDWDYLPIDASCREITCCSCDLEADDPTPLNPTDEVM